MSYLIAATDFSDTGSNALNYACALSADMGYEVVVFHSFLLPLIISDLPIPALTYDEAQISAEESMEETLSGLRERFPNVQIRGSVCYGDLPDGVAGFCAANGKPFMVVVGNSTTGDHGGWLDNHLMELIRRVEVPVVAVPPEVTYHGVANMCFAWDGGGHDVGAALRYLRILVPRHQAKLHVLTTDPDGRNQDNVPQADGTVLQALRPLSPHHHYIYNATLEGALDHFLTENNIDWLVVIPRHRSFWAGLFHRSHTRQLAHRVHLPLVALPEVVASVQD